jgi:hypothetical protein
MKNGIFSAAGKAALLFDAKTPVSAQLEAVLTVNFAVLVK